MTLINIKYKYLLNIILFSTIYEFHIMLKLLQRTQIHLTLNYSIISNTILLSFEFIMSMSYEKLVNFQL